jgi:pantoate--beta-alanine ligase
MVATEAARKPSSLPSPARAETVSALRRVVEGWRAAGESVALAPTMGGLHAGHLALVAEARRRAARTVVSIFVNPTQFGADEDLAAYPRDAAADLAALARAGADLAFLPSAAEMYPEGFETVVTVPGVAEGLCGDVRPGHFAGVATVVAKLLNQCRPDIAVFGEKDYQQLLVIRRLARDLDMGVEIVGVPTVREADGLAMSSRNAYLTPGERATAAWLHAILDETAGRLARGGEAADALTRGRAALDGAGFAAVDYLELRDAETLAPEPPPGRPARLLAAVRLGATRLIDNLAVPARRS